MSLAPSNKKSKTCNMRAEIEAVRHHLLCCNVPRSSRAIQVALQALDQEQQRVERDLKLQRKFASTTATTSVEKETTNKQKNTNSVSDLSESKPEITTNHPHQQPQEDDADLLMEWQDVTSSQDDDLIEEEGSIFGKTLSQTAISKMATHKTTVASPLGAIALALHAALCSDVLGFKCTGIPSNEASKGFAAPIRELPKSQLVPKNWDTSSTSTNENQHPTVKLRYRKDGIGSTVLSVSLHQNDNLVHVQLAPSTAASKESPLELAFPIDSHVNLSSLSKALQNEPRVVPALHYKALPVLLTNMCNTFDLGPVQEDALQGERTSIPYVDTTIVPPSHEMSRPSYTTSVGESLRRVYNQHEPPTMKVFEPELRRPGDFSSDLLPAGGMTMDPLSGNLMGPNHPAFGGNNDIGGGYGMRPRFDPFGPPRGPQDPNNSDDNLINDPRRRQQQQQQPRRPPPGGVGDPNPDHERPPNNLSNNMFM